MQSIMPLLASLLGLASLISPATCHLFDKTELLPEWDHNFKIVAHVDGYPTTDLTPSVEKWEVSRIASTGCDEFAILRDPSDQPGTDFWGVESIKADHESPRRRFNLLVFPSPGPIATTQRPLKLSCFDSSGIIVVFEDLVPKLKWPVGEPGQFYACQTPLFPANTAQVFYRWTALQPLPEGCVDISLIAKCSDGPDRGNSNLAMCCTDVVNGECITNEDVF